MAPLPVYPLPLLWPLQYYFETIFPRIPKPVMDNIVEELKRRGLPYKPKVGVQGNAGQGGPDRRGVDDGNKRPPSVKASLSVAFGQRAPNRAGAREDRLVHARATHVLQASFHVRAHCARTDAYPMQARARWGNTSASIIRFSCSLYSLLHAYFDPVQAKAAKVQAKATQVPPQAPAQCVSAPPAMCTVVAGVAGTTGTARGAEIAAIGIEIGREKGKESGTERGGAIIETGTQTEGETETTGTGTMTGRDLLLLLLLLLLLRI
eukprot:1161442-Pelagomonas_calceolata.AAC.11